MYDTDYMYSSSYIERFGELGLSERELSAEELVGELVVRGGRPPGVRPPQPLVKSTGREFILK